MSIGEIADAFERAKKEDPESLVGDAAAAQVERDLRLAAGDRPDAELLGGRRS